MGSSADLSRSSRRRSLVQSASKTFAFLDRPKSRKQRLLDGEVASKIKITTPPHDFRDPSNNSSSSSSISRSSNTPPGVNSQSKQFNPQSYLSPQDKPLPSLPVATIMSGSPAKTRRLLIDAEERPLRRSVSPSQKTFEDWPTLSPHKQRSATPSSKVQTQVKPSISEGLAERIKQLNLDDDVVKEQEVPCKNTTEGDSLVSSPLEMKSKRTTRPKPSSKSHVPQVRQNRASQLRLCMSQGNLGEPKHKKNGLPSTLAVTSGNTSTRARPLKRPDTKERARIAARSRSRSRHRVTAEGSPRILPHDAEELQAHDMSRKSSLDLDVNRIDTNFSNVSEDEPQASADPTSNYVSEEQRKSSIPLPKRLRPPLCEINNRAEFTGKESHEDRASGSFSGTFVDSHGAGDAKQTLKDKFGAPTRPQSDIVSSPIPDDNEHYQVRSVSRAAPDHGPTLRISPKADEFLRGIGSGFESAEYTDTNKRSSLHSLKNLELSQPNRSLSKGKDTIMSNISKSQELKEPVSNVNPPLTNPYAPPAELHVAAQAFSVPRKAVSNEYRSVPDKQNIAHATTTSAPPIKSGIPVDNSRTNAWPFKESAVAPFKTATTPERNIGWNANGREGSNRSSNTSSQNVPSSGHSVRSRYAIGEALTRVTPIEKTIKQSPSLANTAAEMHQVATSGDAIAVFPPRSTSRSDQSTPLTGLRKTSTPMQSMLLNKTIAARTPTVPKSASISQRHLISSAARGTHTPTISANAAKYSINNRLPSPAPSSNPMSTGKGVLKNIRTLFHKRSNLHASIQSPLHRVHGNNHGSTSSKQSMLTRVTMTPAASSQTPRSPQVKGTSSLAGRTPALSSPSMFPANPSVRPLASPNPVEAELESTPLNTPTHKKPKLKSQTQTHQPSTPTVSSPNPLEPAYLTTATNLVYTLLDMVQNDVTSTRARKEELVDLSRVLVEVLTHARDVEMALESVKAELVRCEMRAGEVRVLVGDVERLVRGLGLGVNA